MTIIQVILKTKNLKKGLKIIFKTNKSKTRIFSQNKKKISYI